MIGSYACTRVQKIVFLLHLKLENEFNSVNINVAIEKNKNIFYLK